jgi:multicomponent K+:H+ antiporter subunit G
MSVVTESIIAFFLVTGAFFALVGSLGLSKLKDFYMRLHGPTKSTTLGLGCILTASAIYFTATTSIISLHEILITIFLFITAPVSAHILSKTALLKDFDFVGDQEDPLEHPLNVHTDQDLELGISEELFVDSDEPDDG